MATQEKVDIHKQGGLTPKSWERVGLTLPDTLTPPRKRISLYAKSVVDGSFPSAGFHHRNYLGANEWGEIATLFPLVYQDCFWGLPDYHLNPDSAVNLYAILEGAHITTEADKHFNEIKGRCSVELNKNDPEYWFYRKYRRDSLVYKYEYQKWQKELYRLQVTGPGGNYLSVDAYSTGAYMEQEEDTFQYEAMDDKELDLLRRYWGLEAGELPDLGNLPPETIRKYIISKESKTISLDPSNVVNTTEYPSVKIKINGSRFLYKPFLRGWWGVTPEIKHLQAEMKYLQDCMYSHFKVRPPVFVEHEDGKYTINTRHPLFEYDKKTKRYLGSGIIQHLTGDDPGFKH